MTTLNATKVRNNFFNLVEEVQKNANPLTVTIHGEPKVVMMPADEFESLIETVEIMNDPDLVKSIAEAEEEIKRGEYVTLEEVLEEEGYVVLDDNKLMKKDDLSGNIGKRGKKKSKKSR